jgi:hypothetical protein
VRDRRHGSDRNLLAAAVLGYVLGSIPFGLLLTRLAGLGDIRQIGSGNIGQPMSCAPAARVRPR